VFLITEKKFAVLWVDIKMSKPKFYKCSVCGLEYTNKRFAEKCEKWCKKHNSCNLEIIKHAVKKA